MLEDATKRLKYLEAENKALREKLNIEEGGLHVTQMPHASNLNFDMSSILERSTTDTTGEQAKKIEQLVQ